jgi:HEAT repeat protein
MQALAQLDPHEAIPELLVRTNDWVPQVRYAAKKTLRSLMTDENAAAFIDYLPEIAHLGRQQRDDHAILIEEVHAYLLRPHNTQHLIRAVSTAQPRVARIASRLCMEHALLPEQALLSACLASADMLTRMSIMPLLYQGSIQDRLPLLAMAVANSCMQLRRAAFVVYCREQHAASTAIAQSLLFDRSAALRELAMGVLAKRGISVPDLLQPVLEQPSATPEHLRHAIWGLAQLKQHAVFPRLGEFRQHAHASVRRATILALARLDAAKAGAHLLDGLKDASPAVHMACVSQLIRSSMVISLEDLLPLLRAETAEKWDGLILLLEALRLQPEGISQRALGEALTMWNDAFNRSQSQPATQQLYRIRKALEQCGGKISREQRQLIEFSLPGLQR